MTSLPTCKCKKDIKKNNRKMGDIIFSIISQWGFSAAETSVLIQSAPKPYAVMSVLVTSSFVDGIKNEQASTETSVSALLVYGKFINAQGQLTL